MELSKGKLREILRKSGPDEERECLKESFEFFVDSSYHELYSSLIFELSFSLTFLLDL